MSPISRPEHSRHHQKPNQVLQHTIQPLSPLRQPSRPLFLASALDCRPRVAGGLGFLDLLAGGFAVSDFWLGRRSSTFCFLLATYSSAFRGPPRIGQTQRLAREDGADVAGRNPYGVPSGLREGFWVFYCVLPYSLSTLGSREGKYCTMAYAIVGTCRESTRRSARDSIHEPTGWLAYCRCTYPESRVLWDKGIRSSGSSQ